MVIQTPADYTGTGATVSLATIAGFDAWCKIVQVMVDGAGAQCRIGDALTTNARGTPILPGGGQFLPPIGVPTEQLALSQVFVNVPNGTKIYVLYVA